MKNNKVRASQISKQQALHASIPAEQDAGDLEDLLTAAEEKQTELAAEPRTSPVNPKLSKVYLEFVRQGETPEAKAQMAREKDNYLYEWPATPETRARRAM